MPTVRMRTPGAAVAEIKKSDPDTSVSEYFIRHLACDGKIPCVMAGRKRLINYDSLLEYLSSVHNDPEPEPIEYGKIRPIKE